MRQVLTHVIGGSRNFSPGTSIHVIAIAFGSPGEHGSSKSCTITSGLFTSGPDTCVVTIKQLVYENNNWLKTLNLIHSFILKFFFQTCEVIKRNKSYVGNIDFEIQPFIV